MKTKTGEEKEPILEIKNLSVSFDTIEGEIEAVRKVSFSLYEGEILAIVGESGCGKSVLCKTIMGMLPGMARIKEGKIRVKGTDITGYKEKEMQQLRGSTFSMVFQDPLAALNPSISIGRQISEALRISHKKRTTKEIYHEVLKLMEVVGILQPEKRYVQYPNQFSGGMRQRAVIAMALASHPQILFADEPTTSLDVTVQKEILDLLKKIQKERKMATVFVSHDLGVVAKVADRVAIMYAGKIVEIGTTKEIFADPRHPYTWGLMRALPAFSKGKKELYAIPGMPPALIHPPKGDAFACRNAYALAIDYEKEPPMFPITDSHQAATWLLDKRAPHILPTVRENVSQEKKISNTHYTQLEKQEILLEVKKLSHQFALTKKTTFSALKDVSFQIYRGEIFGLVGESGSGKSTLARCIMNLYHPTQGQIFYKGQDICDRRQFRKYKRALQSERQMIFQDSSSSLDPKMKVKDIIKEPLCITHKKPLRGTIEKELQFQLRAVGMEERYLNQYPSELSGGQRQRVAIARALSMEPEFLVADEPIASLDVSMQAQIINLFRHLQEEHGFTFLFIAHDLSMVEFLCDRVGVLCQGELVEVGPVKEVFAHPKHPYTKKLLASIPVPDLAIGQK